MGDEDKRTAVGISVNLSTQLIAAALATLAIEGAYVSYALGDRDVKQGFSLLCLISGVLLIASIVLAGKGITKARNAGYAGNWDLGTGKAQFNWQAILCALALLLFGIALVRSGSARGGAEPDRIIELQSELSEMRQQLSSLDAGHSSQESSIADAMNEIRQMEQEIQALQARMVD